jgi:hypothetical protein
MLDVENFFTNKQLFMKSTFLKKCDIPYEKIAGPVKQISSLGDHDEIR